MARDAFEYDVGGLLRDRYGRRELAVSLKHAIPLSTDTGRGYAPSDGDGREQVVLVGADGSSYMPQFMVNVKDYGAKGDGVTNDTAAVQTAMNAVWGNPTLNKLASVGGILWFPPGVYMLSGLIWRSGVHLRGAGLGAQVFSDTDPNQPFSGTVLKQMPGTSVDMIVTDNFAALDATPASATVYNTPARMSADGMVFDGNSFNVSAGRPLALFARGLSLTNVIVQNGKGDGVYVNGPTDSNETELFLSRFRISNSTGNGLNLVGDHDLIITHGVVSGSGGLGIIEGANLGTALFSDIHVFSSGSYNWRLGSALASHVNCISDGSPGVQLLVNGPSWRGGAIYGGRNQFDELVCLGDGTTRTIQSAAFDTTIFNVGVGGRMFRYRNNTTVGWNRFRSNGNLGDIPSPFRFGGEGYGTATGPIGSAATSITLATVKTAFTTGTVVVSDGTHIVTASVTSITGAGATLNLSGALGTAMNAGTNNVAVWNLAATPGDTFELQDAGGGTAGFFQVQNNPSGITTVQMNDSISMVGRFQPANGLGQSPGPALYASAGAPSNSAGSNGDWDFGGDGHIYFKTAGAWALKV